MQGNVSNVDALFFDLPQKLLRKMKSRRRSRRTALVLGIDSLVTVLVLQFVGNVRRQGHFA